jgi:hypothetical protein
MSILKIRDANNQFQAVQTVKGDKGDPGELSTELKLTMLNLVKKVIWTDGRGERYYQDLWNALYGDDYQENFSRVGNPRIENGILTSASNGWIETPFEFNPGSDPWELTVKLYRPSFPAAYEEVVASNGISLTSVYRSANMRIYLYKDDGTIVSGSVHYAVPAAAWRWLKVAFNGECYDYGMSTDGFTYTWAGGKNTPFTGYIPSAFQTTAAIKAGAISIGSSNSIAKFDLREVKLKVNGQVVWQPYVLG